MGNREILLNVEGCLVIVGGGEVDLDLLARLHQRGSIVVGADGGAQACADADIVPAAIIGDLDSLSHRAVWEDKTRVIEMHEQETTDFEKCLYSTQAKVTVCLGMSGKRLDHTLAALDILARYASTRKLAMVSETDLVLAAHGKFSFRVKIGARVSIHPLMPISFEYSKGLEFALDGVVLAPGVQLGTSNRAINGGIEILPQRAQTGDGKLLPYLVIIEKTYLDEWLREDGL